MPTCARTYTHVHMRYPFLPVIYRITICTHTALFTGLPRFGFWFEFIYYAEVEEQRKTGKAWEHLPRE